MVCPSNLTTAILTYAPPAYPPADNQVRNFFLTPDHSDPRKQCRWATFLSALFDEAAKIVPKLRKGNRGLAEAWHNYLSEGRRKDDHGRNHRDFYELVVTSARKVGEVYCFSVYHIGSDEH